MAHDFKPGDRAMFAYDEDLMEGIVQETFEEEIIIQFEGVSCPSSMYPRQLQHVEHEQELISELVL